MNHIFVYGTLQRGEERAHHWPHAPLSIVMAEIRAELWHLGTYPAIIAGNDRVVGELWQLRPNEMERTLAVLDEVECYGQEGVDLYVRRAVECLTQTGEKIAAYTYYLADEAAARSCQYIGPGKDGLCRWPRRVSANYPDVFAPDDFSATSP